MVCIAPKGMLPRALLRNGSVALHDLVKLPVVGLDSRDPVGTSLSQACRQAGVGFQHAVVTVQTYHAALAMAHHGLGVALVDGCTAGSADRDKVDVLTLEPHIPVPIRALRFAGRPDSVAVRSITRCMREAIEEMS
jgi:DNA-binding transcriptional LysR family regulator